MSQQQHFSVDLDPTADGWYLARCNCGWEGGVFPTAEDACDALMEHAYARGAFDMHAAGSGGKP